MKCLYPTIIQKDKTGHYFVSFPDFEEAATEGENIEEALFNASEVLTLTIEGRLDEKMPVPLPSKVKRTQLVAPAARVQAALLIHFMKDEHTTAEIARSLNTSWPSAQRLENPHHWPTLKQLEKVAHVFGKQLVISME